jgi:uncharacterized membrane-anchored protein
MNNAFSPFALGLLVAVIVTPALAQDIKPMTEDEKKAVWDAANAAIVNGPIDVALGSQAQLHLDATLQYIPKKEAAAIMQMWGNSTGDGFYGLVFDKSPDAPWTISIDHVAEGFVKDDDAKTWNADDLLQSLKEGTALQNEERAKLGIDPLEIVGWVQKPNYDISKHQLAWSVKGINPNAPAGEPATINYNTYALGRDGYFQVNLMTTDKTIDNDKSAALKVVSAVDYNDGKRYGDFNAATDHIAEYGLAALVAGVAAKKLGLLAVIGLFIAKFAKLLFAAAAIGAGGLFKMFRKKPNAS